MWCCFTANTAVEPTKLKPLKPLKPIAAEVPVAVKPVTLMFRLPSEDVKEPEPEPEEPLPLEDAQGEEVPSLDRETCNNPCTILLAIATITLLYALMSQSENGEL